MNLTSARAAFALFASAALVAALTSCASSGASDEYPDEVRTNFVTSCAAQEGATESMCDRCFEAVEDAYTYDEFVELDNAIRAGTASDEDNDKLAAILADCA